MDYFQYYEMCYDESSVIWYYDWSLGKEHEASEEQDINLIKNLLDL